MRRRAFIAGMTGLACAQSAFSQRATVPVIAYVSARSSNTDVPMLTALREGLKETGFVEGQNLAIEYRWGDGQYERLPTLAADVARYPVAVIVTGEGELSALAAKQATSTIPIVFNVGGDPRQAGLVASLNRPGSNLTGVSSFLFTLGAKQLDVLRQVIPSATDIGVMANPHDPGAEARLRDAEAAAASVRQRITVVNASNEEEIDRAFVRLVQEGAGALAIIAGPFFVTRAKQLINLAAMHRLPTIYFRREFAVAGGLMSYGSDTAEGYRQMGVYAGKILLGANPADLPVIQPTKFELVINLRTATALGLAIPPTLLARADEVIE
jgi:putative ABC transport system substrate-binding protein